MAKPSVLVRKKKERAVRALQQGQHAEAARLLKQLCQAMPRDPDLWTMLASTYGQRGDYPAVIDCCQRAVAASPRHPEANSLLGNALALLGRHVEALPCYRIALELKPNDPGILNNLGNALFLAGALDEAAEKLEQVVAIRPDYADAHNNLGNIYKALNDSGKAITHYQQALALNPKLLETWLNLGRIYADRIGFPEAAEECFRKALELKPDSIEAESGLVGVLRFQGKLDDSMALIKAAIKKRPEDMSALAGEADILERQGNYASAYEKVRALLQQDPNNPMAAAILVSLCQRFDCCDEAIQISERLTESGTLNYSGQLALHFALGKLHDKLGNHDRAFEHYRSGNELTGVPFDGDRYRKSFEKIRHAYSRMAMERLPKAGHGDKRPVFIIGMPRSGTSLTEQILASHPGIHGAGELNDINDIAAGLPIALNSTRSYPDCVGDLNQLTVDSLASRYLNRLDSLSTSASRITDKMPHNFVNLGLIALLFPDAHIIHCRRDPRDTCLSIYFQNFGWLHKYATDLKALGFYYRLYDRLMQHWETVIDLPLMTVQYEDMVTDQEPISRKLVKFIGLDWDDNCLQFHKAKRTVATASYDQVREPMYTKSVARWKHYEKYIGPLVEALGDTIDD